MKKDVSLGSYYPADSVIHRLNPCIKILVFIAFVVTVFFVKNFYGFIAIGVFLAFAILLSKVPLASVLKSQRRELAFGIIYKF